MFTAFGWVAWKRIECVEFVYLDSFPSKRNLGFWGEGSREKGVGSSMETEKIRLNQLFPWNLVL